jgi:hypothetical protein
MIWLNWLCKGWGINQNIKTNRMKTIALILMILVGITFLVIIYFIIDKFLLGDLSFVQKVVIGVLASVVCVPIIGRVIYVIKDSAKKD